MSQIKEEIEKLLKQEDIKACQRCRDRYIKEGDRNTAHFHAIANQRRRKKQIAILDGPCGPVKRTKDMLGVAADFYKSLFVAEDRSNMSLGPNFWDPIDLVTSEENDTLQKPFSIDEIKEAVFGSYAGGAPGPDGFSFLFYQRFWDLIKFDLMALVRDFEKGDLNVSRLNYAIITLIPKEPEARDMKKFRCSLKIISKAITNRLATIGSRIIASNQTAFIKGRFILESVVAAQELIHAAHSRGGSCPSY